MGRYASYGIVTSFRLSLSSLNSCIRDRIWGKSLNDYDLTSIISQFPTHIYDVTQTEEYLTFTLKDSVGAKDIVKLMRDFFNIYPQKIKKISQLLDDLSAMTLDEMRSLADENCEEYFNDLTLYGRWYGMMVEIDGHTLYPDTDVKGFQICATYGKMAVKDDIAPFNFLTQLLRYRLRENPLADALLSYISQ